MTLRHSTTLATLLAMNLLAPLLLTSTAMAAPTAGPDNAANLSGVSCPRPGMCMAVGSVAGNGVSSRSLAELWNGSRWRRLAAPSVAAANASTELGSVSCTTPSHCVAVGTVSNLRTFATTGIIETWNGTRWRLLHVRMPSGSVSFSRISCVARTCMIVGSFRAAQRPLAMRLVGARLVASTPVMPGKPGKLLFAELAGVDCTAATSCMAVGTSELGAFAEAWNGKRWHITGEWFSAIDEYVLDSVSCTTEAHCMAVGAAVAGMGKSVLLTVLWRSGRWHALRIAGHQIAGHPDVPVAVSCAAMTSCVAVEYGLNNGQSAALTWMGGSALWVHPVRKPVLGELHAISCPSPARCIAVGGRAVNSTVTRNGVLAQMWNGRSWKLLPVTG